jgi:glycosyltransferase involved in cell wall biosynthesis
MLSVIGNGDGQYECRLHEKAAALGIAGNVEWLGYVNNEEKYEIYRTAKVFAHSTVFDNNGMVAAEALCSGLPVVMYDLPALRNVYTTGCLKIPYGEQSAFADALFRLLSNDGFYSSVAPTPGQVDVLRAQWNWCARIKTFSAWLENFRSNCQA